jgi:hypothetical protein
LAVLPQIILSGVLMPVEGAKATALAVWMSKPMLLRWAYGAYTRIEIFDTLGPKKGLERHFPIVAEHIGFMNDSVVADIDIMLGIGIALTAATWAILRSRDRG